MSTKIPTHEADDSAREGNKAPYDLKFVPIDVGDLHSGGWYRELPGEQIEVISCGHLERVPLDNSPPEEKARAVMEEIVRTQQH